MIQCPHCKHLIESCEFMDIGDMEGEFNLECEEWQKYWLVEQFKEKYNENRIKK